METCRDSLKIGQNERKQTRTTGKVKASNKFLEEQKEEENFELSSRAQLSKGTYSKLRSDTIVLRHLWAKYIRH